MNLSHFVYIDDEDPGEANFRSKSRLVLENFGEATPLTSGLLHGRHNGGVNRRPSP